MTPALDPARCLASAWQVAPDLPLRLLLAAGLVLVAAWARAKPGFPGQRAFGWLNGVLALWILGSTAEQAAADPACKASVALLSWPFILAMPLLWVLFLRQFVRREQRAPPLLSWLPAALGAGVLAVAVLGNGWHGHFYTEASRLGEPIAGLPRMHYGRGPLFWLAAAWSYAWLALAAWLILRAMRDCAPAERAQWTGFFVIMLVPWVCNLSFLAFGVRLAGSDPTPLSFAVAAVGFAGMMGRSSLLRVVPMSRRLLFTELLDPVLVLDAGDRVVDCNVAAQTLAAGRAPGQPRGREPLPLGQPVAAWPVFGARLAPLLDGGGSIALEQPPLVFDVQVRPLQAGGAPIGRLVQLRDVTERHRAATRHAAELQEQARRDPLTGVLNRRALAERHAAARDHQRRSGGALALVLIDVDHFKRINDLLGHAEGDRVLQALAAALGDGLRGSEAVFRIGGEEFALLMPGIDGPQALQRVQVLLAALDVRTQHGTRVTCSAGVAAAADAGLPLDQLLRRADEALYAAKAAGRACVRPWPAAA